MMDPEERLERTDAAVRTKLDEKNFRGWLSDNRERPDLKELADTILESGHFRHVRYAAYSYSAYAEGLAEVGKPELAGDLLGAESEWRADVMAAKAGLKAVGVVTAPLVVGGGGTADLPVPVVQCGYKDRRGTKCPHASMPGALRCREHGGDWLDPAIRQRLLLSAYMQLVENSEVAVEALIWVAANGKREEARVMAAREILDRAGIRAGVDVNVNISGDEGNSSVNDLKARLKRMGEGMDVADAIREQRAAAIDVAEVEPEPAPAPELTDGS